MKRIERVKCRIKRVEAFIEQHPQVRIKGLKLKMKLLNEQCYLLSIKIAFQSRRT